MFSLSPVSLGNQIVDEINTRALIYFGASGSAGLDNFFSNIQEKIHKYAGYILTTAGIIGLIVCAVFILKKVFSSEGSRMSWVNIAIGLIFSAALAAGGFGVMSSFGDFAKGSVKDITGVEINGDSNSGLSGSGGAGGGSGNSLFD